MGQLLLIGSRIGYDSFSDKVVDQGTKSSKWKSLQKVSFFMVLDSYVCEEGKSRIFLQN